MTAPPLLALPFTHWSIAPPLLGVSIAVAALYTFSAARAARWPRRRTLAFLGGLLAIQVALQSGLDAYDDRLLSAHMLQHLLLIELAPALLLYAAPVQLALRTLPPGGRQALAQVLVVVRARLTPVVCLALFTLVVLGMHVPLVFDAAVRHPALHEAEHAAFLLAGLLVWWPLLGDPAPSRRPGPIAALVYVSVAMLPMTAIGAYLDRAPSVFYSAYAAPARALDISPLVDQQRAGAIMWVAGTTVMAVVGLACILRAMVVAERRQRASEVLGVLLLALVVLLVMRAPVARGNVPAPRPVASVAAAAPSGQIAEGRRLYDQTCASCHGMDLRGRKATAPSLHGVGAGPIEFYLSTGRMPLDNPRQQPMRSTPAFDAGQIAALVAYITNVGGGPPSPDAKPAAGSLSLGFKLFDENCAGCHSIVARGGITVGAQVPDLQEATPRQIAQAVRMGPYLMPHFGPDQIDQHDLDSLARYVIWTRHPSNPGGWGIYNIGPIPEGIVAWFIGLLLLVIIARLIGERTT